MLEYTFPLVSVIEILSAVKPATLPNNKLVIAFIFNGGNFSPESFVVN